MDPIELYTRHDSPNYYAKIKISDDNIKRLSTKSSDKEAAYRIAYKAYIEAKTKADLGISDSAITFGQMYSLWDGRHNANYAGVYKKHLAQFGKRPLAELTTHELNQWLGKLELGSIRKHDIVRVIHRVFELAIDKKLLPATHHPNLKVKMDPPNPRPHFTDDEIQHLLLELDQFAERGPKEHILKYMTRLMLGTGIRPGQEVEMLRWTDFQIYSVKDGKARYKLRIRPETNKTRKGREVVMDADTAFDIDTKWRLIQNNWGVLQPNSRIFLLPNGESPQDMFNSWDRLMRITNLEFNDLGQKRPMYSLRHTYITKKLVSGVPPHIVAKQVGHSAKFTTEWYSKATPVDWADILTTS